MPLTDTQDRIPPAAYAVSNAARLGVKLRMPNHAWRCRNPALRCGGSWQLGFRDRPVKAS